MFVCCVTRYKGCSLAFFSFLHIFAMVLEILPVPWRTLVHIPPSLFFPPFLLYCLCSILIVCSILYLGKRFSVCSCSFPPSKHPRPFFLFWFDFFFFFCIYSLSYCLPKAFHARTRCFVSCSFFPPTNNPTLLFSSRFLALLYIGHFFTLFLHRSWILCFSFHKRNKREVEGVGGIIRHSLWNIG